MRAHWIAGVVSVAISAIASAETIESLTARSLSAYEQIESIRTDMQNTTGSLSDELSTVGHVLSVFDEPLLTTEELDELDTEIAHAEKRLTWLEERNESEDAIARARMTVERHTMLRRLGTMSDKAARKAWRQKLTERKTSLEAKLTELATPYRTQMKDITASVQQDNKAFTDALSPFFLTPATDFEGVTLDHVNFTMHSAFGGVEWKDAEGKQIAWAHIRLRDDAEIQSYERDNLLDELYPIRSTSDYDLWVWAGNFLVTFVPSEGTMKNKELLQAVVTDFVDLEGLAAIEVDAPEAIATGSADAIE
ncbi:MAG: hypothetical protein AAF432_14220 [Planctomycetota bacterium]